MTDLQDRLSVLEREASQHQEVLQSTAVTNKVQISKLQEEKAMLEVSQARFHTCDVSIDSILNLLAALR